MLHRHRIGSRLKGYLTGLFVWRLYYCSEDDRARTIRRVGSEPGGSVAGSCWGLQCKYELRFNIGETRAGLKNYKRCCSKCLSKPYCKRPQRYINMILGIIWASVLGDSWVVTLGLVRRIHTSLYVHMTCTPAVMELVHMYIYIFIYIYV